MLLFNEEKSVCSKYFNYDYSENVDGVKNFVLKDGLILWRGADLVNDFKKEQDLEFLGKVCEKLKEVLPIYEKLSDDFGFEMIRQGKFTTAQIDRATWTEEMLDMLTE